MIKMTTPQYKTPPPPEFTILVYRSLLMITLYSVCLIYVWERRRKFMDTPQHKNAYSRGHEIQYTSKFSIPFLAHHYCILSLSDLCSAVMRQIFFFKSAFFLKHMNPCPRGREIYNSLDINTINSVCLNYDWEQRRQFDISYYTF